MAGRGILLVLSGPSGAGKTTLARRLVGREAFVRVTTCTTRPMRRGEADGKDYHFLTREEFEARIAGGRLLEHARIHGELYGTPREAVLEALEAGKVVVLAIDVQGARAVRGSGLPALHLFVEAPDRRELVRRIRARGTETEEQIRRRLRTADEEMKRKDEFDAVVVNDEIDGAVGRILDELRGRGFSV